MNWAFFSLIDESVILDTHTKMRLLVAWISPIFSNFIRGAQAVKHSRDNNLIFLNAHIGPVSFNQYLFSSTILPKRENSNQKYFLYIYIYILYILSFEIYIKLNQCFSISATYLKAQINTDAWSAFMEEWLSEDWVGLAVSSCLLSPVTSPGDSLGSKYLNN